MLASCREAAAPMECALPETNALIFARPQASEHGRVERGDLPQGTIEGFQEGVAMAFAFRPAVASGAIGAIVMVMLGMLMKRSGVNLQMNVVRMWGTMLGLHGTAGRAAGWIIHLVVSAAFALAYAGILGVGGVAKRPWRSALSLGVIHWIAAGLYLATVPSIHPEIPEKRPAPGPFAANYGRRDVLGFLMAHLVFGTVVEILYPVFLSRMGRPPKPR
jgi:hypothetical protein